MIRSPRLENTPSTAPAAVWAVLEDVIARRLRGEEISDEAVLFQYSDLMPHLGRELLALRRVEAARGAVGDSGRGESSFTPGVSREWRLAAEVLDSFPGYEVREIVGRGASGVVYRALQTATLREVAIKAIFEGSFAVPNVRARFEREAQILAQLRHPHIVAVHDTGWTQGRFYLVMDLVAGEPLDAYVDHQRPPLQDRLKLFAEICEAVHAAHLRGVIHRDLKPRNILVDTGGEPRLVDFGLAKLSDESAAPSFSANERTTTGQFVGSLPWASPEQVAESAGLIDLRSDIYSLGVVFYQVLTGRFPYSIVGNLRDVIDRILTAEPARPRRLADEIDDEVETILLKCLAKDRERRYQSAGDLARDFRRYLAGEPIEAKRDSTWYVFHKMLRRNRWTVAAAVAFFVLATAYALTVSVLYHQEQDAARRARHTLDFLSDTLFSASSHRLGADATLEEVLDATAARLQTEFKGEPLAAAKLHYSIGSAYETIWKKSDGARHLRIAADLYESVVGPDHPDTLAARVYLGMVLAEMRDPASVEMLRRAVETRIRLWGEENALVADAKANLGYALWSTHKPPLFDDAERIYSEALDCFRRTVGSDSLDLARMLTGWASMRIKQQRSDEALQMTDDAERMARKFVAPDHQFLLESALNRSEALRDAGRFAEAEATLDAVVSQAGRRFGAHHVPRLLRRMAVLRRLQGDPQGAIRKLSEAVAHSCRQLAARHSDEQARWNGLADRLTTNSLGESSVLTYRDAVVGVFERTRDADEAVRSLLARADLASDSSNPDDVDTLLSAALTICDHLSPESHRLRGTVSFRLANTLKALGEDGRVEPLLLEAVEVLRTTAGIEDDETQAALRAVIEFYEAKGRETDAELWRPLLVSHLKS